MPLRMPRHVEAVGQPVTSTLLTFAAGYLCAVLVLLARARMRWARWLWRSRKQPRWLRGS